MWVANLRAWHWNRHTIAASERWYMCLRPILGENTVFNMDHTFLSERPPTGDTDTWRKSHFLPLIDHLSHVSCHTFSISLVLIVHVNWRIYPFFNQSEQIDFGCKINRVSELCRLFKWLSGSLSKTSLTLVFTHLDYTRVERSDTRLRYTDDLLEWFF
jgi:hypothetical protein